MPTQKIKQIFSFLLRIGLSGALLYYLFAKVIDKEKTLTALQSADVGYIAAAFAVFTIIIGLLVWRWTVFLRALDLDVPLSDVIRFYFLGLFGNLFLPSAIGGDMIKIIGLCRENEAKARVVASVLLDRLSGFAAIVLVAVCSFAVGYRWIQDLSLLVAIGIMGTVSFTVTLVLFNETIYSFCCRLFNPFPKLKKSLMSLHYDIVLLQGKRQQGYKAIAISCLSQFTLSIVYFLLAKSFHQDVNLIFCMIFVPMICVASAAPSIGGLGVREAGAVYLFAKIGVAPEIAVNISILNFAFMTMIGLAGIVIYNVITLYTRRVQRDRSADDIAAGKA